VGGELARVIRQADEQLKSLDPSPFSPRAFNALQEQISRYIAELIADSAHEANTTVL